MSDELARFLLRALDTDQRTGLERFKRRKLLRIYLRDCLKVATLADLILRRALALAHQEMTNRHGAPLTRDPRGRIQTAEFAVVALGKLGCRELNYASDIDLLYLFAGEGDTAGDGRSPASIVSNKASFKDVQEGSCDKRQ